MWDNPSGYPSNLAHLNIHFYLLLEKYMNTIRLTMDPKTNVGTVDRAIRFVVASALIAVPLLYDGVDAEYAALTSLFAIPLMFTAISRWCPLYAFLHVQSIRHKYEGSRFYGRNISKTDAVFRYLLGSVLILATMSYTSIADPWLVILALLAIPIIHTAILLWDPVYAAFEISTFERRAVTAGNTKNITDFTSNNGKSGPPKPAATGGKRAA
jgi:hypothetical protein